MHAPHTAGFSDEEAPSGGSCVAPVLPEVQDGEQITVADLFGRDPDADISWPHGAYGHGHT